jgi:hypothetical protein
LGFLVHCSITQTKRVSVKEMHSEGYIVQGFGCELGQIPFDMNLSILQ